MKKRLKANRCPEFDCRSKKRTKLNEPILEPQSVYKCDKCGRVYTPCCDPSKLWHLKYNIKNLFKWKIPYKIKNFISKEKQELKYKQLQKNLEKHFDSHEGKTELERNAQKIQRESELKVGWFSPEEDEAWGTVENPCPKCINDCKYFYKIGRMGGDFTFYGNSCPEFINLRGKKTVDFNLKNKKKK